MKTFLILVMLFLMSCSSKEKAVNANSSLPVLPMLPASQGQAAQDSIGRAPTSAIEGQLLLQGDFPTPLTNIQLGLYKKQNDRWIEVGKLSTDTGGNFRFTQKLTAGVYDLRILDSRYKGSLPITLESDPKRDLVLFANKLNRKDF